MLNPAVVVDVEDKFNNLVATDQSTVVLALSSGPFGSGSNTVSVSAVDGIATFSGLTVDQVGGYSVSATDGTLDPTGPSNSFTISPAAASQIAYAREPSNAVAGAAIAPAVKVEVEDQYNNLIVSDSSTVTLTLSSGSFEGGSNMATAVVSNGVATFGPLTIDLAGKYTASATDGTLTGTGEARTSQSLPQRQARLSFRSNLRIRPRERQSVRLWS